MLFSNGINSLLQGFHEANAKKKKLGGEMQLFGVRPERFGSPNLVQRHIEQIQFCRINLWSISRKPFFILVNLKKTTVYVSL